MFETWATKQECYCVLSVAVWTAHEIKKVYIRKDILKQVLKNKQEQTKLVYDEHHQGPWDSSTFQQEYSVQYNKKWHHT